ncbi:MAG: hypothetical protein HC897_02400, partial [Thermoanaerobaculia bacterium]|nr:hypothetical protein [Thermoanaerobaculia bacterium]
MQTAISTLLSVFPEVEIWQVGGGDLLLVASLAPIEHDFDRLRAKVEREPFRRALLDTWRVDGLEGFYTGYIGGSKLARHLVEISDRRVSTDDRPLIEFHFVRNLGRLGSFDLSELQSMSRALGAHRPAETTKALEPQAASRLGVDWQKVASLRHLRAATGTFSLDSSPEPDVAAEEAARRLARE